MPLIYQFAMNIKVEGCGHRLPLMEDLFAVFALDSGTNLTETDLH